MASGLFAGDAPPLKPAPNQPSQDLFSEYDADASGSISFDELATGLRRQGYEINESEVRAGGRGAFGAAAPCAEGGPPDTSFPQQEESKLPKAPAWGERKAPTPPRVSHPPNPHHHLHRSAS